MKRIWSALAACLMLTTLVFISGCGVNQKKLDAAEQRLNELRTKGIPDSVTSQAALFLFQSKEALRIREGRAANEAADSMIIYLAAAEAFASTALQSAQPTIDSLLKIFADSKAELTGNQLKKLEKAIAEIDSINNLKLPLEAEFKAKQTDTLLTNLKDDEKRMNDVKDEIPGTWESVNEITSQEIKEIKATEKKLFVFGKDGSALLTETEKGQIDRFTKMDYEFISWGNWELAGDTVHLLINRFKCTRQIIDLLDLVDGKKIWKKTAHPTFDSTITDGSQDRWIPVNGNDGLKEDFTKKKK